MGIETSLRKSRAALDARHSCQTLAALAPAAEAGEATDAADAADSSEWETESDVPDE